MAKMAWTYTDDAAEVTTWETGDVTDAQLQKILDIIYLSYPVTNANGVARPQSPTREKKAFSKYAKAEWRQLRQRAKSNQQAAAEAAAAATVIDDLPDGADILDE